MCTLIISWANALNQPQMKRESPQDKLIAATSWRLFLMNCFCLKINTKTNG